MDDTILLHDNREYIEGQGSLKHIIQDWQKKTKRVNIMICIFLVLIVVQNVCIFMFLIKIKEFAENLDLGWLESDEMYEYKRRFERIIDEVCKLYIEC